MNARFLADADLEAALVRGVRRRNPAIDFLRAQGILDDALEDPLVLTLAANMGRVLVSHDRKTMPGHFYQFLEIRDSPGLILIPKLLPMGIAVRELHQAWACMHADEFHNRIVYVPL